MFSRCFLRVIILQVRHGHNLAQKTSIEVEFREYTLPPFSVNIRIPDVIENSRDAQVPVTVTARLFMLFH